MKRFLAFLCAIALIAISVVPALANPSIGYVIHTVEVMEILTGEKHPTSEWIAKQLTEGDGEGDWYLEVVTYDPDQYDNEDVKAVVDDVNSDNAMLEPSELVDKLKQYQPEGFADALPDDFADYHFITRFDDLILTNGVDIVYMHEDDDMSVRVKIQSKEMMGVKASDLGNYLVMHINPATGKIVFTPIEEENFDSKDGFFVTEAKVLGPFAIIQKI